jgi:histidine triad (HIT) family protein
MNDIFDKIISKEIPAQFIYEDEVCVAVMDKFPVIQGQVLVIPKDCEDYLFNFEEKKYQHCMSVAKRIAKALDTTYGTLRTCLLVEGFEVPHAHIKLYPVMKREFHIHGGKEVDDETLAGEAEKIKTNLD